MMVLDPELLKGLVDLWSHPALPCPDQVMKSFLPSRGGQMEPGSATRSQDEPGAATRSHEEPGRAMVSLEDPGGPRWNQEEP